MPEDEHDLNGAELREKFGRLDERLEALRERITIAERASEKARGLAAEELKAHLEILNGAYRRADEERARYLEIAKYEGDMKAADIRLRVLEAESFGRTGRLVGTAAAVAFVCSILAALALHLIITK